MHSSVELQAVFFLPLFSDVIHGKKQTVKPSIHHLLTRQFLDCSDSVDVKEEKHVALLKSCAHAHLCPQFSSAFSCPQHLNICSVFIHLTARLYISRLISLHLIRPVQPKQSCRPKPSRSRRGRSSCTSTSAHRRLSRTDSATPTWRPRQTWSGWRESTRGCSQRWGGRSGLWKWSKIFLRWVNS